MSSCKEMDRLIQLYVDQEIEEADRHRLKDHVAECKVCRHNLEEMIDLVQSLEGIRNHDRKPSKAVTLLNHLIKWMAVYTAIAFLVAFAPGMMQHRNVQITELASRAGDPGDGTGIHHVMVLATQGEKLHIPKNDYIQVIRPRNVKENAGFETALVYPSALPFVLDGKPDWFKEVKRFVFVRVPDDKTMEMILTSSGLTLDRSAWEEKRFPMSVILTTGNNPHLETFTFPDDKQNISRWFDKMAATPTIR